MTTKAQQKKNRKKWIKALRSENYKQTTGRLRVLDENNYDYAYYAYCCLGVACDLYRIEHDGAAWTDAHHFSIVDDQTNWEDEATLPPPVQEWLGLASDDGSFDLIQLPNGNEITSLIDANDNEGFDFLRIADLIEEEPQGLVQ